MARHLECHLGGPHPTRVLALQWLLARGAFRKSAGWKGGIGTVLLSDMHHVILHVEGGVE